MNVPVSEVSLRLVASIESMAYRAYMHVTVMDFGVVSSYHSLQRVRGIAWQSWWVQADLKAVGGS
jgi:hypothetical protein